jgi:hypothetical protein
LGLATTITGIASSWFFEGWFHRHITQVVTAASKFGRKKSCQSSF